MRLYSYLILLAAALAIPGRNCQAEPTEDGLYAGFLTSEGTFWCRLEFERVPRTVANFVSLAEGTRDWIDFTTSKIVRRPFYNGISFHRVITNFMIQGGSPNGRGTDGPGYSFKDEFNNDLKHSVPGTLSMANSGPNSNGAQFFVTVTNTPWLDNLHTVFGYVVEGIDVVHAISKVPRDAADRPLTPVVINELKVLRRGAAATAFDPANAAPPMPDVGHVPAAIVLGPGTLNVLLKPRTNHLQHAFYGTNLVNWVSQTFRGSPTNLTASGLLGYSQLYFRVLDGGIEP